MSKQITRQEYETRVARVCQYIEEHLDEPLPLEELARVARFSPFHFHRIFRGVTGESLKEHVRRLRMERAARRLRTSERSVTDLAFDAGYESLEAFTRRFSAMFGASPTQYRQTESIAAATTHKGIHVNSNEPWDAVKIVTREPTTVAARRHVGPYEQVGTVWGEISRWAGMRGLFGPQTAMIGAPFDDPDVTDSDKLRYDACITVKPDESGDGYATIKTIDGGEYAVVRHVGPYSSIGETYRKFFGQWVPQSGRELRDLPSLEFYRNSPMNTAPENLITDIHFALEPLS